MKKFPTVLKFVAMAALLTTASVARAEDEDEMAKAPPAVQAAVKAVMGKGTLEGFESEEYQGNRRTTWT